MPPADIPHITPLPFVRSSSHSAIVAWDGGGGSGISWRRGDRHKSNIRTSSASWRRTRSQHYWAMSRGPLAETVKGASLARGERVEQACRGVGDNMRIERSGKERGSKREEGHRRVRNGKAGLRRTPVHGRNTKHAGEEEEMEEEGVGACCILIFPRARWKHAARG